MPFPAPASAALITAIAAGAICTACALPPPAPPPAPAHPTAGRAAAQAVPGLAALLPVSPDRLRAAAAMAAQFTTAYTTHSPGQTPGAWLARLAPMATAQLTAALARAAPWQANQITGGQVTTEQNRDLTPGSVTVTVGTRQSVTTSGGRRTAALGFAVTLTSQPGTGWAVYGIEPAGAGNAG
jgi:hypothetical protein